MVGAVELVCAALVAVKVQAHLVVAVAGDGAAAAVQRQHRLRS
jgi:hypothetical protein